MTHYSEEIRKCGRIMKEKLKRLSLWSIVVAVVIFVSSYFIYHYIAPDGSFTTVFQEEPGKPFVTQLWASLGVLFLFAGIFIRMIAGIFYPEKK